jgi:hypothetical protein
MAFEGCRSIKCGIVVEKKGVELIELLKGSGLEISVIGECYPRNSCICRRFIQSNVLSSSIVFA